MTSASSHSQFSSRSFTLKRRSLRTSFRGQIGDQLVRLITGRSEELTKVQAVKDVSGKKEKLLDFLGGVSQEGQRQSEVTVR